MIKIEVGVASVDFMRSRTHAEEVKITGVFTLSDGSKKKVRLLDPTKFISEWRAMNPLDTYDAMIAQNTSTIFERCLVERLKKGERASDLCLLAHTTGDEEVDAELLGALYNERAKSSKHVFEYVPPAKKLIHYLVLTS